MKHNVSITDVGQTILKSKIILSVILTTYTFLVTLSEESVDYQNFSHTKLFSSNSQQF